MNPLAVRAAGDDAPVSDATTMGVSDAGALMTGRRGQDPAEWAARVADAVEDDARTKVGTEE